MRISAKSAIFFVLGFALHAVAQTTTAPTAAPFDKKIAERARATIEKLTSPEFAGRGAETRDMVVKYLETELTAIGLRPIGDSYKKPANHGPWKGTNVVGFLPGSDPELAKRHIIVSAHFDHLGKRNGVVHPGASDNAAGTAACLETARLMAEKPLRHSVAFCFFDLEEVGLIGSRAYAAEPAMPLDQCDFFATMDILGRRSLGVVDDYLIATGWERSPEVLAHTRDAGRPWKIEIGHFGSDISGDRSDFVAFREKKIPFLFFTTAENEDYHKSTDTADKIDFGLLSRQIETIQSVVRSIDARPKALAFAESNVIDPIEFESFSKFCGFVRAAKGAELPEMIAGQLIMLERWAQKCVDDKTVGPDERKKLLGAARQMQGALR